MGSASLLVRICGLRRLLWRLYGVNYCRLLQCHIFLTFGRDGCSPESMLSCSCDCYLDSDNHSPCIAGPQLTLQPNLGIHAPTSCRFAESDTSPCHSTAS